MKFEKRIHEAFNARSLATEDVCKSFIVTPHYFRLAAAGNSILVGPRGSGKTTLMRMLQVEAINIWSDASDFLNNKEINYSGVFIPTDKLWSTQYELLKSKASSALLRMNVELVFGYHILERFLQVVEYRARREKTLNNFLKIDIDKQIESDLVYELADSWGLNPRFYSLRSLCISVKEKWRDLVDSISRNDVASDNSLMSIDGNNIIYKISEAAVTVNTYFGQHDHIWTLLFDELELAPPEIVQNLVEIMRGGPINLNFKLSMSPYHRGVAIAGNSTGQMRNHDFEYIDLTQIKDNSASVDFSKELAIKVLNKNLGGSSFSEFFESPKKPNFREAFESLEKKDDSFKKYLDKIGINTKNWDDYPEKKRTEIRRFQYVAFLRDQFFAQGMKKRTIKRPLNYYSGGAAIFKALEFNPRMIISFFNNLIEKTGSEGVFSVHDQLDSLKEMRISFEALINTISLDIEQHGSLLSLVSKIGTEFSEGVIGLEFRSEPSGSFIVTEDTPRELIDAIGLGVNSGAFIKVIDNTDESRSGGKIVGQRFRLSFLFAHKFRLPLQLMRACNLLELLSKKSDSSKAHRQIPLI
jgi:hypothetical protein